MASRVCPSCTRPIREVFDVPFISVMKVERLTPPSWSMAPTRVQRHRRAAINSRLQEDVRRIKEEQAQLFSVAKRVVAGDAIRKYVASLRPRGKDSRLVGAPAAVAIEARPSDGRTHPQDPTHWVQALGDGSLHALGRGWA